MLPVGWYAAKPTDYRNAGFDRGHLCPSDDRDSDANTNLSTFAMTNIVPQAPKNNKQTWRYLEAYEQKLVSEGKELYIIAGTAGQGGSGENGNATTLADGKITVPASLWKIIVVLPVGRNDLNRIDASTQVIAISIPNTEEVGNNDWKQYQVSVSAIEKLTGYTFFSNLPTSIQKMLKR
jgi:endonuclease G